MSDPKVQMLLKRHKSAMEKTAQWKELLDTTYFYALPNRNPFDDTFTPGTNLNERVYDGTLVLAMRKFVNRMIKALMPPEINWMQLSPGKLIPDELKEEKDRELQEATETFFFYLRQSNFDLAIYEAFTDMAVSTGVLQCNEGKSDEDPLIFSTVPQDQVGFETDPYGGISGIFREWKDIPVDQAQWLWNDELKIPEEVMNSQPPHKMCVIECSYYDFKEDKYKYYVIESKSKKIMYESDSDSWAWIPFRWSRTTAEDRGRGPAIDAMPTATTINRALEDEMKSASLKANPPYMAFHDFVINPYNFRIEPNTIIPVNPTGTETWPIAPLPNGGDIAFSALIVNDLRSQINEIMMAIPLQPTQGDKVRTATEVAIVNNELRENAGAAYSRLQRELFDPLVKRVIYILQKKGLMNKIKIDGKEVAITYQTPLSASKNFTDIQTFVEFYQILSGIFTPGVAINLVDAPKLPRWMGQKLNTQLDLIKDESEIISLIQQAMQMGQEAIQQQQPGPAEVPPTAGMESFGGTV